LLLLIMGVLGGCAIHPLPEDYSRVPTYQIVRQIRCETRQALIDVLFTYLTTENNMRYGHLDKASYDMGVEAQKNYLQKPDSITQFDPSKLTGFAHTVVGLLYKTGIAYNYDLLGLETNNIDPTFNLLRPVPATTQIGLNVTATFDRSRQNERSFTVTDNAGDLLMHVHQDYCDHQLVQENFIYPIAGQVGVGRVVIDFMQLTLFGNLGDLNKDAGKVAAVTKGPPTMVDQLQFVTAFGGTVTPKLTFIPLGRNFNFADANVGLTNTRKDTHQLTVGLYLDEDAAKEIVADRREIFDGQRWRLAQPKEPGPARVSPVKLTTVARAPFFGNLITASGSRAELGAAQAVEQFLTQKLFKPTIVVNQ
jgi:hypothetical protein